MHHYLPDKIQLGHAEIDAQHEMLFYALDGLNRFIQGEEEAADLDTVFRVFEDYVQMHFQFEEAAMEKSGYPERDRHREEHRTFEEEILVFEREMMAAEESREKKRVAQRVYDYLVLWWDRHIGLADRELCRFLKKIPA